MASPDRPRHNRASSEEEAPMKVGVIGVGAVGAAAAMAAALRARPHEMAPVDRDTARVGKDLGRS
jgi:predicted dehydrogenase